MPHLALIVDVDLSKQGAGEGEDVVEALVPKGAGHLAVLGEGAHGLGLVHLRHQLLEGLYPDHSMVHRALSGRGGEGRGGEGRGGEGRGGEGRGGEGREGVAKI